LYDRVLAESFGDEVRVIGRHAAKLGAKVAKVKASEKISPLHAMTKWKFPDEESFDKFLKYRRARRYNLRTDRDKLTASISSAYK
jgi:hypothetical protein